MNKNLLAICLLISFSSIGPAFSQEDDEAKRQRKEICEFYPKVKKTADETDGIQIGILVDLGISDKDKKRHWKTAIVPKIKTDTPTDKPTAQDAIKTAATDINLKMCRVGWGEAICALGGVPKSADKYDCAKEYCFDPKYWAFFMIAKEKWQYGTKGVKDQPVTDGQILGFIYLPSSEYEDPKFKLLSPEECKKEPPK